MRKCALCGKKVSRGMGPFFRAPTEEWRRIVWSKKCGIQFKASTTVCVDHFVATDLIQGTKTTRLMPNAVPFTTATTPQPFESFENNTGDTMDEDFKINFNIPMHTVSATPDPVEKYRDCHTQTDSTAMLPLQIENYKLKEEIKKLKKQVARLQNQLDQTNAISASIHSIFTEGQLRKLMLPEKSIKWQWNDITNAICLHASGPTAYNYLYENGYPLPHVSTLQHWYRKFKVNEGIVTAAIDLMRQVILSNDEKICALVFDEMKVKEAYECDQTSDIGRKAANFVQVVMAQGLKKCWKQPVFFDFDCRITNDILNFIISTLYKAGFPVVAVVCDLGSTNQKLWKSLGVTSERPWFPHPSNFEEKVFAFADSPHLLKLIRNHFLDTGLMWKGEVLTAQTIVDLMKNIKKSDSSIAFKLTDSHISLKGKGWQKSKLAAQVFSNTTANALRHCHSLGVELHKPLEVADMLQLVNDWFDLLNSKLVDLNEPGKEPYGVKLRDQEDVIRRMNEFMSLPIIPGKSSLEQFQRGVLLTNTALVMLHKYLKIRYNMEYIVTYRLNLAGLEHFFGTIRSNDVLSDQPTPSEFKHQLRQYILVQNRRHLKGTGKNEDDTTDRFVTCESQAYDSNVLNISDMANESFEEQEPESFIKLNMDTEEYISGFTFQEFSA